MRKAWVLLWVTWYVANSRFHPIHESSVYFKVEIGLLHDLPSAQSVATEPLSSDDWEIIVRFPIIASLFLLFNDSLQEIHASHVESTLLSQVRVAKIGQEIDVWVLGRTRVRLRVGGSPATLQSS